jgi:hypothetical protein
MALKKLSSNSNNKATKGALDNVTCCPKCGSQATEKESFCSKCGTAFNSQVGVEKKRLSSLSFPTRSATNLVNGIVIGGSVIAIIAALLVWSSLNATFWFDWNLLSSHGTNAGVLQGIMLDNASSISLCGVVVVFALSFLVITLLNQFSAVVRTLSGKSLMLMRLANGVLTGGVIAFAFYAQDYLYYSYANATTPYISANYYNDYAIVGTVLIIIATLLMISSYLKSRNLATKL